MKVGSKIFTVAAVLVAGTTAVGLYSLDRISRVNHEIVTVASYYAPLARILGDVEIHARNEELAYHALLGKVAGGRISGDHKAKALEQVVASGRKADDGMQEAQALAREGLARAQAESDRIKFASMQPLFERISKEHAELNAHLRRVIEAGGVPDAVALAIVDKEVADVNVALDDVEERLHVMTRESAAAAAIHEGAARRFNFGAMLASGIVAVILAFLLSRSLVGPLRRLVRATEQVKDGDREFELVIRTRDEVQALAQAFEGMVVDLRAKERIREKLGKYIDRRIADQIIERTGAAGAGGERQVMTVLFTDLKGFTSISENLLPTTLVKLLNRYLELMSAPVAANSGVIDKYIGDSVMAFWGPPFCEPASQATLACRAALAQLDALARLKAELPEILGMRRGLPDLSVRVGIATGDVVVGNIGSAVAQGYTVVGDTVNLGARLESLNKAYGTALLICEATWERARHDLETREVDVIRVVGKDNPVRIFEVLGERGSVAAPVLEMRDHFETGLGAYRDRRYGEAREAFRRALESAPKDPCSAAFLSRLDELERRPMPPDWDGVWRQESK